MASSLQRPPPEPEHFWEWNFRPVGKKPTQFHPGPGRGDRGPANSAHYHPSNMESAAPPPASDPEPRGCGGQSRDGAAPWVSRTSRRRSPPTPRTAGGLPASPTDHTNGISRRAEGMNPRALGANPRAEADRAVESRQRELAERREAELAAAAATRRAHEEEARVAAAAFEAEADALSAVLDDARLAAVVALATEGLAGPPAHLSLSPGRSSAGAGPRPVVIRASWWRRSTGPWPTGGTPRLERGRPAHRSTCRRRHRA